MYFSREFLLGLALLNSQKKSFTDEDIDFTKTWLESSLVKFKKDLKFFFSDKQFVLDDFWSQYYDFSGGEYVLKNPGDGFIIHNATIYSLIAILKNNGFLEPEINQFIQYFNTNYITDYTKTKSKHLTK